MTSINGHDNQFLVALLISPTETVILHKTQLNLNKTKHQTGVDQ